MNVLPLTLAGPGGGSQADTPFWAVVPTPGEFGAVLDQLNTGDKAKVDDKEATPNGPNAQAMTPDLIAALLPGPVVTPQPTVEIPVGHLPDAKVAPVTTPTVASPSVGKAVEPTIIDLRQIGQEQGKEIKRQLQELGAKTVVVQDDEQAPAPTNDQPKQVATKTSEAQTVRAPEIKDSKKLEVQKETIAPHQAEAKNDQTQHEDQDADDKPQDAPADPKAPAPTHTAPAQTLDKPEPKKAAAPKPVVDQVADAVHDLARAKRPGKVTVILEPAHLGSVTVTVKHSGSRFTADIQASDPVLSQQLADNKQDLIQAADARGLSMDSFNVSHQDAGNQAGQQQTREEFQRTFRLNQTDRLSEIEVPAVTYATAKTRGFETLA